MKKGFFSALGIIILFVGGFFFLNHKAYATPIDDLRSQIQNREQEIKKLEEEIKTYQNALDKQVGVSTTLKGEISRIQQQIKKLQSDIRLTQIKIEKTELSIQELSLNIDTKQKEIERDQESLGELLRASRESGEESLIEVLLARGSVATAFDELQSYESVNQGLQQRLDDIRTHKTVLENDKSKKETEDRNLLALKNMLTGQKVVSESQQSAQARLLKESKNQESQYQKILRDRAERRAQLQQEMQDIENKLKALIDPSSIPSKGSGALAWPIASPQVTQQFGFTQFATTYGSDVYGGKGHNGIDLRAPVGTPIYAAADGIIKNTGNADALCPGGSYGKWIVIEHSNGLSTLYGHLSAIGVSAGQSIKRGDQIGFSGNTGYTTGPHLHFTVYASNTYQLYQTKHCGKIPAGGYLNPIDYL